MFTYAVEAGGDTLVQASSQPGAKLQPRLRGGVERMQRMSALPTWPNLLLRSASPHLLMLTQVVVVALVADNISLIHLLLCIAQRRCFGQW